MSLRLIPKRQKGTSNVGSFVFQLYFYSSLHVLYRRSRLYQRRFSNSPKPCCHELTPSRVCPPLPYSTPPPHRGLSFSLIAGQYLLDASQYLFCFIVTISLTNHIIQNFDNNYYINKKKIRLSYLSIFCFHPFDFLKDIVLCFLLYFKSDPC